MSSSPHFITKIVGRYEAECADSRRVSPKEFLDWAEKDLAAGDKRGQGNSLGNVKRALHSRIDQIIAKTHVQFTKDWNPKRMTTDQKLDIIRELGIQHEAIVDVLTAVRNDYEHDYVVPTARAIRAHLHAAQLWLEKSYAAYEFRSVGFAHLPLLGIGTGAKRPNGSAISIVRFGEPQRVVCFRVAMKCVLTIHPDGAEETVEFKSLSAKEMLQLEAPFIREALAGGCSVSVDDPSLTDLLDRYREWVRDTRSRNGQPNGPANGSQPIRSETNPTSSAAGSCR